ncbi:MAG TPA: fumarylacetoacetate hydrolase family protein [Stellaceae bacterium]|jgi:2-keto-4-pentenoate hydratase|nr:fumarylacetoacetate hydrolase family protein [Stellaceae bacterium]
MVDDRASRAAELLIDARNSGKGLAELPADCRPRDASEAYAIQDAVARRVGVIRGWKTGAPGPQAEASYAPIFTVIAGPGRFPAATQRLFGIEAEVAFRLARDLPKRDKPYSRDEVVAAIASTHPAIELVDTRFADFAKIDALSKLADNQSNGALIYGPPVAGWQTLGLDLGRPPISVTIDSKVAAETTGNNGGDPLRLLTALANHCTGRTGGLRVGDMITTGSITGVTFAKAGSVVIADFGKLGTVRLEFPL